MPAAEREVICRREAVRDDPPPRMPTPSQLPSGPRQFPRLKFIWGSREVIVGHWRLGLFGFYERSRGFRFSGLAISVRGLLCWTLALGVAGYVGGAWALTHWLQRNPYNQLGFVDVLAWPVRREQLARVRAKGWLAQGKAAMKEGRWSEGVFYLRRGLDLTPEDHEARFVLSQFYLLAGQRPRALALLVAGVDPRFPLPARPMFEAALQVTFAGEDWASALALCDRALPRLGATEQWGFRQWLVAKKLEVLLATHRAPEAVALAEGEGEAADVAVKLQHARALVAAERTSEAIAALRGWRKSADADQAAQLLRLEATTLREAGLRDDLERALVQLRAVHPSSVADAAFGVEERARSGRGADRALEEFFLRFAFTAADLQLVSQPLARIPEVRLVRRVVEVAKERGYAVRPFHIQLVEAQLRQGDWKAAATAVDAMAAEFAAANPDARTWHELMSALVASLSPVGNVSPQPIVIYLRSHLLSLEAYQLTISALRRAGRDEPARDVIALGRKLYVESPSLVAEAAEVEAVLARRPAPAPLLPARPAVVLPATAEEFFRALDAQIAAKAWAQAAGLAANAQFARPVPEWLPSRERELLFREIRIAQGQQNGGELRTSVRLFLGADTTRADQLLALAREWRADGARDDALRLVNWVIEAIPDHAEARALQAEWRPPAAK